ncbi:uncharacterized protein LOC116413112 isoform X2 [Galleria mellonella]|uniref:Uncharacterized protein LOC116413112 isoform X2 n=1 Tax=Galleria mellonella TaxID=7137 RepID=A0ABM3M8C8_GALME|nr:uncharacterized protein LOC116413112 isoform X2 [Galleria mellonella]
MDNLMMGNSKSIAIRTCPFCRKPIINTQRYKDIVSHLFVTDINPIKERAFGNMVINDKRKELTDAVTIMSVKYDPALRACTAINSQAFENSYNKSIAFVSPEVIRPHSKAGPRKSSRKGRKKGARSNNIRRRRIAAISRLRLKYVRTNR